MRVEYSGKNLSLTDAIKAKAENKLKKLERFTGPSASAHISLEVERHLHRVDLVVTCSHDRTYKARAAAEDMYLAINEAADAIEQQAKKDKEKRIGERGRKEAGAAEDEEEAPEGDKPARPKGPVLVRRQDLFHPKPMSLRDAVLLLQENKAPALVFLAAPAGRLTVLVRDGRDRVIVVEPEGA